MLEKAAAGPPSDGCDFFNKFEYLQHLFAGNPAAALNSGLNLLSKLKELSPDKYKRIHNGTPHYWLAIAAFQCHDYQSALLFIDAAVTADLNAGAIVGNGESPAIKFMLLRGHEEGHAARPIVEHLQNIIAASIADYQNVTGSNQTLDIDFVRNKFILPSLPQPELRTVTTTFLTFFLEWRHRATLIDLDICSGTNEPFFLHLAKGCLLFESILKNKYKEKDKNPTLAPLINEHRQCLGINGNSKINIGCKDPADLTLCGQSAIADRIIRVGKMRNCFNHSLSWPITLDGSTYNAFVRDISSALLHAVACLYK